MSKTSEQSPTNNNNIVISAACEKKFLHYIQSNFGLFIHSHQYENLRNHIKNACKTRPHASADEYLDDLASRQCSAKEIDRLIADITVGESYFFRDKEQMGFLKNYFLPTLIEQKRQAKQQSIRIWSAGCANGQELSSIAIMLYELLPDLKDWSLTLIGSDIDRLAVEKAKKGIYNKWSLRDISENIRKQYFSELEDNIFKLDNHIASLMTFFYMNLSSNDYPSIENETVELDLILCRNVFIYFDPLLTKDILTSLYRCLAEKGALITAPSDLMNVHIPEQFEKHVGHAIYYTQKINDPLTPTKPPAAEPQGIQQAESLPESAKKMPPQSLLKPALRDICEAIAAKQWEQTLALSEQALEQHKDNAKLWQYKAKALANLGDTKAALNACKKSLMLDDLAPYTYYLNALILIELKQQDEAEKTLRQALFLNKDFLEAHYQLGLILIGRQENKKGLHTLRTALKKAEALSSDHTTYDAPEMNMDSFITALRQEINRYEQQGR
jgi:chemotaxis protein methyltransferase CheR